MVKNVKVDWKTLIPIGEKLTGLNYKEHVNLGKTQDWWKQFCISIFEDNLSSEEYKEIVEWSKRIENKELYAKSCW